MEEGGVSRNADKSGQGEGGGLAESGHPFQCGFWKREKGQFKVSCHHHPVLKIENKEANRK